MKKMLASIIAIGFILGSQVAPIHSVKADSTSSFSDVEAINPYAVYINDLKAKGAVVGYAGKFSPLDKLTRAQFATMLVKAYGLPVSTKQVKFADSVGHWAAQYIESAYDSGAVVGTSDTTFEPDAPVKREEAAQMVWKLEQKRGVKPTTQNITPAGKTDAWALDAVKNVLADKFYGLEVQNNDYLSQQQMNREQAAALIDLALNYKADPVSPILNPTTNTNNLVDSPDGTKKLGNITIDPSILKDDFASQDEAKADLTLYSNVVIRISGNTVSLTVPATGKDNLEWTISDYTNKQTWEGSNSKQITFSNTSSVTIGLFDPDTAVIKGGCSLLFKNGEWKVIYPHF